MARPRNFTVGSDRRLAVIEDQESKYARPDQARLNGPGQGRSLEVDDSKLEAVFCRVLERGTGGMFTFAGDRVVRMGGRNDTQGDDSVAA